MMTKQQLEPMYGYFKMVLGMTRKLVEQFPEDKMQFRPVAECRTVAELVGHLYGFLVDAQLTAQKGEQVMTPEVKLATKAEALAFMDSQVAKAFEIFSGLNDAQFAKSIEAYGEKFQGWQFLTFAYDEHWHHRGQLTVYLRLLGIQPIMIYDYGTLQG
ncbi:MAG: DinB family protein [Candidatus Eisenbacteria bacterium]